MSLMLYFGTVLLLLLMYVLARIGPVLRTILQVRRALLRDFPTPTYHWLYGHMDTFPGMTAEGLQWCYKMAERFPRYFVLIVGPVAVLELHHPETVKQLTKTAEPKQLSYGGGYTSLLPWIGDGLLVSSGSKWFRNRKLLTPGFHFDILKPYVTIYNNCTDRLMEKFENESALKKQSIDIFKPVSHCTLDIILQCAFSSKQDVQSRDDNAYAKTVSELARQVVHRSLQPLLTFDFIYYNTRDGKEFRKNCALSHQVADDVIAARRRELQETDTIQKLSGRRYVDFLDILLLARDEDGQGLSPREIRDEVEAFMFAGHDTTSSGISWILYNLANNPEVQAKARQEVDAILDGRHDDVIQWNDLNSMPYLTRCIRESLRLNTTVPFIGREITTPLKIDDKVIPAGAYVDINMWNLHHNPEVWEDPMTYNPDRFLPDNMTQMDSHAFMPFSAGPRNCIGQNFAMNEMKTTVARILRRFEMTVDENKEIKVHPDVVLRSKSGIHLFFNNRS